MTPERRAHDAGGNGGGADGDFLERADPRIERIAEGYLDHLLTGNGPGRRELIDANPDIADRLDRRLTLIDMIHGARPSNIGAAAPEPVSSTHFPGYHADDLVVEPSPRPEPPRGSPSGVEDFPEWVGPYRVLELLGQGGMGVVYLADQTHPIRRRIALKLIQLGMHTQDVIARFETERQALALMNHTNIARVFEAGATETGRPYFAMEYVAGVSITEYADRNRLSTRDRLELFCRVCDGVQHAHHKGIIHRDLKPSNILVTANGTAVPKIIDFGVAKATNQRLTEQSVITEVGRVLGTPEYMSPEQAEHNALDIDTRTDIYSLGVILYELLSGTRPFESKDLRRMGLEELRRRIREVDPPKPSTRLGTAGSDSREIAKRRRTDPGSLTRLLRGDLDCITMKAMEKDRTRRYASASELKADIERHLAGDVVLAGPPTASYRIRKFVGKHRAGVVVGIAVVLLLGIGMTGFAYQASVLEVERARATEVAALVRGMFESLDPSVNGYDARVADLLDDLAREMDRTGFTDPLLESELHDLIGWGYRNLGLFDPAERHLATAWRLREEARGPGSPETLRARTRYGVVLYDLDRRAEARAHLAETLEAQQILGADAHAARLTTAHHLALVHMIDGRLDEAESLLLSSVESVRSDLPPEDADLLSLRSTLASVYRRQSRWEDSERLYREILGVQERTLGLEHEDTIHTLNNLGTLLDDRGRYAEARDLFESARDGATGHFGESHPRVLTIRNNLASSLYRQGRLTAALEEWEAVLQGRLERLPPGHREVLNCRNNIAGTLIRLERYDEAEPILREVVQARAENEGKGALGTLMAWTSLGSCLRGAGRLEEAEAALRRALQDALASPHAETHIPGVIQSSLGNCLHLQGRHAEAKKALESAVEILETKLDQEHSLTVRARDRLVEVTAALDETEESER